MSEKKQRPRDKGTDGFRGDWAGRYVGDPLLAYSPRLFCRAAGISLTLLYTLWRKGQGPPFKYVASRRLILIKDAEAWMKQLPNTTPENITARMNKRNNRRAA